MQTYKIGYWLMERKSKIFDRFIWVGDTWETDIPIPNQTVAETANNGKHCIGKPDSEMVTKK
ncbi:MAG: hypothetical protein COA57_08125 [Flavobacteriales bacterium]|nr:MAG: hypothetical protein COA57_08125 [Flavobacteriales bacterium]